MPRRYTVASIFLVFHCVALFVASIPNPGEFWTLENVRVQSNPISVALTPALDRLARLIGAIQPLLFRVTAPARFVTRPYISAGVGEQHWRMFSNPQLIDSYVRVDNYVLPADPTSAPRVIREMALPAQSEDEIRVVHVFTDKAIMTAIDVFSRPREAVADISGDERDRARRSFQPIARYFRGRARRLLREGEHIIRTEVWFGESPNPRPGAPPNSAMREARRELLARYYPGPIVATNIGFGHSPGFREREADIAWRVLHIDEPEPAARSSR